MVMQYITSESIRMLKSSSKECATGIKKLLQSHASNVAFEESVLRGVAMHLRPDVPIEAQALDAIADEFRVWESDCKKLVNTVAMELIWIMARRCLLRVTLFRFGTRADEHREPEEREPLARESSDTMDATDIETPDTEDSGTTTDNTSATLVTESDGVMEAITLAAESAEVSDRTPLLASATGPYTWDCEEWTSPKSHMAALLASYLLIQTYYADIRADYEAVDYKMRNLFNRGERRYRNAYFDSLERVRGGQLTQVDRHAKVYAESCPICMTQFEKDQVDRGGVVLLPCHKMHIFCKECINLWLKGHKNFTCPLDRRILFEK